MSDSAGRLHAFEAFGVEIETMIVDRRTLDIQPRADLLLRDETGQIVNELETGEIAWSNELCAHVLEFKTQQPAGSLRDLDLAFAASVTEANARLAAHDLCLMPGGVHPWMDPARERVLWPHENGPIYQAFDRIFDCRGHGWSNLQSTHLNLPFGNDDEFVRLHAAVRLTLPLLPAIAAASPLLDARVSGWLAKRIDVYRSNCARVPEITAAIVPEAVRGETAYRQEILAPMYRAIAPLDPEGILQEEWLNARGAIARFERGAIEIRILDAQECPAQDLALVAATTALVRAFWEARWLPLEQQLTVPTPALAELLIEAARLGRAARVDAALAPIYDVPAGTRLGDLWARLLPQLDLPPRAAQGLDLILTEGALAERLLRAVGTKPDRRILSDVWRQLCACLAENRAFAPRPAGS